MESSAISYSRWGAARFAVSRRSPPSHKDTRSNRCFLLKPLRVSFVTKKPDLTQSVELDTSGALLGSPHTRNSPSQYGRDNLSV